MTKSRFHLFDKGHNILESLAIVAKNITVPGFTMGLVGAIFSASIGVALIMLVAKQGKLSDAVAVSWLLAAFVFAGLATMIIALYTREPIVIAWSIPGALIVGKYLQMGGNIYDAAGAYIMIAVNLPLESVSHN